MGLGHPRNMFLREFCTRRALLIGVLTHSFLQIYFVVFFAPISKMARRSLQKSHVLLAVKHQQTASTRTVSSILKMKNNWRLGLASTS
jgi:hypothetical protein